MTSTSRQRRVLIVDDSAFARRKTRELVERLGHHVREASSGPEALALCESARPDAMVLDLLMAGGMDGGAVLRELRRRGIHVPVIVATADVQDSTAAAIRGLGAQELINKPLSLASLAPALARALRVDSDVAFDAEHRDALAELINIGYGRAAAALSTMSGERVQLSAPQIELCSVQKVESYLTRDFSNEVACVNQVFSGPLGGNAMLLLDVPSARLLSALLEREPVPTQLNEHAREVISELGNIVLNACLGVFGNLLKTQVSFAVPRMHVESVGSLLRSVTAVEGSHGLRHTVLIKTQFYLSEQQVGGYLAILLTVESLSRLQTALSLLCRPLPGENSS